MATEITCINCGVEGVIKTRGLHHLDSPAYTFKRVGRNPVSGHLHYQCPACEIVLLVDPALIRPNHHIFARKPTHPSLPAMEMAQRSLAFVNPSFAQLPHSLSGFTTRKAS